jgi:hypothetical protein
MARDLARRTALPSRIKKSMPRPHAIASSGWAPLTGMRLFSSFANSRRLTFQLEARKRHFVMAITWQA